MDIFALCFDGYWEIAFALSLGKWSGHYRTHTRGTGGYAAEHQTGRDRFTDGWKTRGVFAQRTGKTVVQQSSSKNSFFHKEIDFYQ